MRLLITQNRMRPSFPVVAFYRPHLLLCYSGRKRTKIPNELFIALKEHIWIRWAALCAAQDSNRIPPRDEDWSNDLDRWSLRQSWGDLWTRFTDIASAYASRSTRLQDEHVETYSTRLMQRSRQGPHLLCFLISRSYGASANSVAPWSYTVGKDREKDRASKPDERLGPLLKDRYWQAVAYMTRGHCKFEFGKDFMTDFCRTQIRRYAPWNHTIHLEGVPTREKSTAYRRAIEDDRACQISTLGRASISENLKVQPITIDLGYQNWDILMQLLSSMCL